MKTNRLWLLGAADPEMKAIEDLLTKAGEKFQYATIDGERVHPGNAYKAEPPSVLGTQIILIECGLFCPYCKNTYQIECPEGASGWCPDCGDTTGPHPCGCVRPSKVIDHHRPGDPGFGRPPDEFFGASSIGQVVAYLQPTAWSILAGGYLDE